MRKKAPSVLFCLLLLSSCGRNPSSASPSSAGLSDAVSSKPSVSVVSASSKPSVSVSEKEKSEDFTDEMLLEISKGASLVCECFHQTCWSQLDDDGKKKDFISGSKNWIDIQFTPDEYAFQLYEDCEVPLNRDPDLYSPTKNELQLEGNYCRDRENPSKMVMKKKDENGNVVFSAPTRGEKKLSDDFDAVGLYDFFEEFSSDMFVKTNRKYTFELQDDILEDVKFQRRVSNAMTGADPFSPLKSLVVRTNGLHVTEFVVTTEDTSFSYGNLYYLYHHTYTATVIGLAEDEEVRKNFL